MKKKNIILLSMARCGMSWVGEILSQIHERLYGDKLTINYELDRRLVSNNLLKGWTGVYEIDPKILLDLGYDKVIIIKRKLETLIEAHAKYHGYLENYGSLENMKKERSAFFDRIKLAYKMLYEQELDDPRILIVNLEQLNNYTYSAFEKIIDFLEFKLSFIQKVKLFLRILRNKVKPFIIPTNPKNRNWDIFSAMLPIDHELCNRLKYMQKIE